MSGYLSPPREHADLPPAERTHAHDRMFKEHPKFQKNHAVFLSKADRFKHNVGPAPSPTTYQTPSQSKPEKPSHTFRSTTDRSPLHNVASVAHPNPGKYDSLLQMGKGHGAASRFQSVVPRHGHVPPNKEVPDPGTYHGDRTVAQLSEKGGASHVFASRTPRMGVGKKHHSPAVTSYDHHSQTIAGHARKHYNTGTAQFRSRTAQTPHIGRSTGAPAPGHVTVKMGFERAAEHKGKTTVAFSSQQPRLHHKVADNPPPGHYDPLGDRTQHGAASVFRSTSPRVVHGMKPQGAGPAETYAADAHTISARSRSAVARPSHHFQSATERFKAPKPVHDAEPNLTSDFSANTAKRHIGKAAFRSNDARFKVRDNAVPGPGHYVGEATRGDASPNFHFQSRTPRLSHHSRSYTPGPGTYQTAAPARPESPAASFRSNVFRTGFAKKGPQTGPGHYHPTEPQQFGADAHASTRPSRPKGVAFGSLGEDRFKDQTKDTPGPGHCVGHYSSFLEKEW